MPADGGGGEPLDHHVPDAFLAATATVRSLVIVTRNRAEFRNTGVETVDPWTGRRVLCPLPTPRSTYLTHMRPRP